MFCFQERMMKKALVIVAHPDDETIWMGGTILQKKEWDWKILSLCRANDKDRAPKFAKVCKLLNAKGIIANLDDEILEKLKISEIQKLIKEKIKNEKFDFIFTHGKNGEYGHIRHKEIHLAVKKMHKNKELKSEKLFFFSYISGKQSAPHDKNLKIPVANTKADLIVSLSAELLLEKRRIIEKIYEFKHPIFETLACGNLEAFDEI